LSLVAEEKRGPTSLIDRTFRMMKQLARAERCVSGFGEACLQRFDFRVSDKIIRSLVAAGGGSELPRKDRSTAGSTEDTGRVGVREVDTATG